MHDLQIFILLLCRKQSHRTFRWKTIGNATFGSRRSKCAIRSFGCCTKTNGSQLVSRALFDIDRTLIQLIFICIVSDREYLGKQLEKENEGTKPVNGSGSGATTIQGKA